MSESVRHAKNRGYGPALQIGFRLRDSLVLRRAGDDRLRRPARAAADSASSSRRAGEADIVSGSRYLDQSDAKSAAPAERRRINTQITQELNERLGLSLTDAFCGFKAYRVPALEKLTITEPGYAMPLELWVQAAHHGLRIVEVPVPLVYLEEERSFGGSLDDGNQRLAYYHQVLDRAVAAVAAPRLQQRRRSRATIRQARLPEDWLPGGCPSGS